MKISEKIIERIKQNNSRFYANDNISSYIEESELPLLVDEVAENFDQVLRSLIIDVDNDPNSNGTSRRLAKMYINEIMSGRYYPSPNVTAFPNGFSSTTDHGPEGMSTQIEKFIKNYSGMLVVRSELTSLCSHHHQTVRGVAYIGIIPHHEVIGLSKYSRIAQHCAKRGTLQEELTKEILDEIVKATGSKDVGVYIQARHGCCENRGLSAHSSMTQTCLLSGEFHKADVKKEFFDHIALQQQAASNIS